MRPDEIDELEHEYDLDYSKSRPNRFATSFSKTQRIVVLDDDIAESFPSSESVNEALRFLVRITRENQVNKETK